MDLDSYLHHFCLFFQDGGVEAGWIEGIQKNKLKILPQQGKTQFLAPNHILFDWKGVSVNVTQAEAHAELKRQFEEAHRRKLEHDLETIHELLVPGKNYTLDSIAMDFLEHPGDEHEILGLLLALREDTYWFKRNRDLSYTPRKQEELEQLEIQVARRREREQLEERIQEWIQQLDSSEGDIETWQEQARQNWLDQLEQMLIKGHESSCWKSNAILLGWGHVMGYAEESRLKLWLERAGRKVTTTRLLVMRANGLIEFDADLEPELNCLEGCEPPSHPRVSETLPTFTIDGEKTRDFDDALTVYEWNKNGIKLAVHITDLSERLDVGSLLFREAEKRISSVYTPDATYPMLPERLSNGIFSLKVGEERAVLSFHFQLFRKGGWKLLEVAQRRICVRDNLSYLDADERIRLQESFWDILHDCCDALLKKRLERGALNLARHEFEIDITDPKQIQMTPLNRNSPSNRIIEELAVLVNSETGRLFHEAEFPGIYRTQASYELIKEVEQGENLTLEHISIEPARLSTVPEPHAGLGCELYMQITSPIRRFLDLVTQRQLCALLDDKEPVFDLETLMRWAKMIQSRQRDYSKAEREVLHYWKSRYLQQHTGFVYAGRIRRQLPNKRTEIEFRELDYVFPAIGFENMETGTKLELLLREVQLEPLRLNLRLCETDEDYPKHVLC